ncbi:hypothetical protein GCM10023213_48260 [Prosthecobacter algae]|uniref:Delta-60 repeat protein n=1 Tax=Prosthecobacter algae TaxID=1144682 RepID=A0ABP9PPE2_9BACT
MADSYFDAPRRGNRDWPDIQLADGVSPLNRVYNDSVTLPADLLRKFPKEEMAARMVLTCTGSVTGPNKKLELEGGYEVRLVTDGAAGTVPVKVLAVDVRLLDTGAKVAAAVAAAVNGWLPMFTAVALGARLGIYTGKGQNAVLENTLGWVFSSEDVALVRPGFPPECTPGTYHPQCEHLVLVEARLTSSTDTHATFARRWQVDLARLDESAAVDVPAVLKQGMREGEQVEQSVAPPRQFLPWLKTLTQSLKTKRGTVAAAEPGTVQSAVTEENLASAAMNKVRQEWGTPVPLRTHEFDLDSGEMREVRQEVVPAGTLGKVIGDDGRYETVQQVDHLWAIRTTVQASGLAGLAQNGTFERAYKYRDNYAWPRVLHYIDIQAVPTDPRDIYSPTDRYCWRPVWLVDAFNGPCNWLVKERWTSKKPQFARDGGDPNWSTLYEEQAAVWEALADTVEATNPAQAEALREQAEGHRNASPDLPTETPMQTREIEFRGSELQIYVPECLHSGVRIWDGIFFQEYPRTVPMRWPREVIARVSLTPDQGGWLTRTYIVEAPSDNGRTSGLELWQAKQNSTGFTLEWTREASGAPQPTTLTVATDPTLKSGIHEDLFNKTVTPAGSGADREFAVTNVRRGRVYYARIQRGGLESNLCICTTEPVPELQVLHEGETLASGTGEVDLGNVEPGRSNTISLTLLSAGMKPLENLVVELVADGPDEDVNFWNVEAAPLGLPPSASDTLDVTFAPVAAEGGTLQATTRRVTLRITSNAEGSPFLLKLKGMVAKPEIEVEQPAGVVVLTAGLVDFGAVSDDRTERVFKLRNVGNAPLLGLALTFAGTDANDFSLKEDAFVTELGPQQSHTFTVVFDPAEDPGAFDVREARLEIVNNDDDENPYVIRLSGVLQKPRAPGVPDPTFPMPVNGLVRAVAVQADGDVVIGGDFTMVKDMTRNYVARVKPDGTLDSTFDPGVNGPVLAVAVQANGNILLGGQFGTVGGNVCPHLARVDASGNHDDYFLPDPNGEVRALAVQRDGKIVVGGNFTLLAGMTQHYYGRLLADGSVDSSFFQDTANNGPVNALTLTDEGKIVMVGDFAGEESPTTPPPTLPPTTWPPTTWPPTPPPPTSPPPTSPPPTSPPPTSPPPTSPPTTWPPTTWPPTTWPPTTWPPTTWPPTTWPPTTWPPPTSPPTTPPPTSPPTTPPPF